MPKPLSLHCPNCETDVAALPILWGTPDPYAKAAVRRGEMIWAGCVTRHKHPPKWGCAVCKSHIPHPDDVEPERQPPPSEPVWLGACKFFAWLVMVVILALPVLVLILVLIAGREVYTWVVDRLEYMFETDEEIIRKGRLAEVRLEQLRLERERGPNWLEEESDLDPEEHLTWFP